MIPAAQLQRLTESGELRNFAFHDPEDALIAWRLDEVCPLLEKAEAYAKNGGFSIGYVSYEAARAFDPTLVTHAPVPGLPLAWFGLFTEAVEVPNVPPESDAIPAPSLQEEWSESVFIERIARVRDWIARGHTYQVNLTYRLFGSDVADPYDRFLQLSARQTGQHHAWLQTDTHSICSASPELFFRRKGNKLTCRPMKGTAPRDVDPLLDTQQKDWLATSAKNQAENVMIVDMIRNDLGKVAKPGSVTVSNLYHVESYPTVHQMTSTVEAESEASLVQVFEALFPCASITGAPKRRTMELIRELETSPRGVYTGCIGSIFPGGDAEFNVAIRTAVIDRKADRLVYGTGCGIVWDSDPGQEYRESVLKTQIIREPEVAKFHLIETLLWTPQEEIRLLSKHLDRLQRSAEALGFSFDREVVVSTLEASTNSAEPAPLRLRLLLRPDGTIEISHSPYIPLGRPLRFSVDPTYTPSDSEELLHKTTRRSIYTTARARCPDVEETLLINEKGELMEFTIGNLVLEKDGERFTPPLQSGCLPGVRRRSELELGSMKEKILTVSELASADGIYLCNAVRGLVEMERVLST